MSGKDIFKRGSIEMIVLILLQKEDCYGYQIVQAIEEQTLDAIHITEGSLYPTLYRLLDHKCISDYKKLVGRRRTRVYYHLEEAGRERLKALLSDYLEVQKGIENVFVLNGISQETEREADTK